MQKLTIENFGPIDHVEVEVKDYMVFIGPQASGKSTISKSIYFFKSVKNDLLEFLFQSVEKKKIVEPLSAFGRLLRKKFLNYWGSTYHLEKVLLSYEYSTSFVVSLTIEKDNKYINPQFSNSFRESFFSIINEIKKFNKIQTSRKDFLDTFKERAAFQAQKDTFLTHISEQINTLFNDDREIIFIPAGRSLLTTLSDQISSIRLSNIDYLMKEFVELINATKTSFNISLEQLVTEKKLLTQQSVDYAKINLAKQIIRNILKGNYFYDSEGEKLYFSKSKYVKLNYSSSGQQESIWILLLIYIQILYQRNVFLVIEEPEAHLFPEAQKEIVELIALLFNTSKNQVLITTHSPYILQSINNLLYASKIGQDKPEKVSEIVKEKLWINNDNIMAYFVEDGKIESIIDEELEIIKAEEIDKVSLVINNTYDSLLELEMKDQNV